MIPTVDTPEAIEGRAAHWVAENLLGDCVLGFSAIIDAQQYVGQTDPDGTVITSDMAEGALMYAEEVSCVLSPALGWSSLQVEGHVYTPIHSEVNGTPDAFWYNPKIKTLYIWDFKYGHGDVAAFENTQLLCYFSGIMQVYDLSDLEVTVVFMVVQPRCYTPNGPVKEWTVPAVEVRGHINRLTSAAAESVKPGAKTSSGNHCRNCEARYVCESSRQAAVDGVSYQNMAAPVPLTDEALSIELLIIRDCMKNLKYRESALAADADYRIMGGAKLHGLKRESVTGHRKFNADPEILRLLAPAGVDLVDTPKAVTPSEAERRLKKAGLSVSQTAQLLSGTIDRPSSGTRVVQDKGVDARRIFSK
jgi:hypothetical protein